MTRALFEYGAKQSVLGSSLEFGRASSRGKITGMVVTWITCSDSVKDVDNCARWSKKPELIGRTHAITEKELPTLLIFLGWRTIGEVIETYCTLAHWAGAPLSGGKDAGAARV